MAQKAGNIQAICMYRMFTVQQLSGEENSRRKHSSSLQCPAPQARVPQVTAQSKGSPAYRYLKLPVLPYFTQCNLEIPKLSSFTPPPVNSAGETALDVARRLQHTQCVELVRPHFLAFTYISTFYIPQLNDPRNRLATFKSLPQSELQI